MDYNSPDAVVAGIIAIFPDFEKEWESENPYVWNGEYSIHSVYMMLLEFLPTAQRNDDQIKRIATLINEAVEAGDTSENAISTCFLEHVYQVGLGLELRTLLSPEARQRSTP